MDIEVTFPASGCIQIHSHKLLGDPASEICNQFVERVLQSTGVLSLSIHGVQGRRNRRGRHPRIPTATVNFCAKTRTRQQIVEEICARLMGSVPGNYVYSSNPDAPAA